MNTNKALQSAVNYHRGGDLKQAEALYKKVLKKQPNNIDALRMLGGICYQLGDYDNAIRYIKKEIEIRPSNADAHNNLGLVLQARGLLSEAIEYFRKAITLKPHFPEAYYNLGFAYQNTGKTEEAIMHYRKAIEIEPGLVEAYNNLGILLRAKGHLEEAITCFQKALRINPNYANTYNNLGLSLKDKGNTDEAIANYKKAIHLNSDFADAYFNLAIALQGKKQIEEAISSYKKALQLNPNYSSALNNLGNIYHDKGQLNEAVDCYQEALKLKPDFVDAYNNLGMTLREKGQIDEAVINLQKALQINPDLAEVQNNLGNILADRGQLGEAITYFQKAVTLNTKLTSAYYNLGKIFMDKGQPEEAISYYQKAIQIEPNHGYSHWNLSLCLLLLGNFKEGWKEYEWRRKIIDFPRREFSQPLWDGSDISGKTILLHTEQGFGDAIQFIRYTPLVAGRGANVIIECLKELISLFQNVEGINQIIAQGEQLPSFDVHCPLLSLPLKFNTTIETIPAEIPYIKVNTLLVQKWKDRVRDDNSKFKVGLVWAGNPKFKDARIKACSLETFSALSQFKDITFYSLQKGDAAEQTKNPPEGMKFIDYTDEIDDFSDTAALIENLDLVISIDTAVAHLAGALGKPVWTLIPFAPDWRWMLNREDSPWYPTMRLFRQPSPGDWQSVINKVAAELRKSLLTTQDKSAHSYANHENSVSRSNNIIEGKMGKIPDEDDFYQTGEDMLKQKETVAIILKCEGIGDCLFAIAVIKKLHLTHGLNHNFVIFTHHPELFMKCPYVEKAYDINNAPELTPYQKRIVLFDTSQMPHWLVDTYDFISIPAGIGELSFREKQPEYFPLEDDRSEHYDVVINTSETWPSRSWPIENWQKVADYILAQGYSIAVVGKDTFSKADNMWKRSQGLKGCINLTNKLSLDQTYFTIKNCDLFITCQNGLSVLSGATDTEVIVLDMSIEWSKRAIYRNEDPHYKVKYVKGNCELYCCSSFECPTYGEFRCIPTVEQVLEVVRKKLNLIKKM